MFYEFWPQDMTPVVKSDITEGMVVFEQSPFFATSYQKFIARNIDGSMFLVSGDGIPTPLKHFKALWC